MDGAGEERPGIFGAERAVRDRELEVVAPHGIGRLMLVPDDVDVPLGVLAIYWKDTGGLESVDVKILAEKLARLSLLESLNLDPQTLRVHDVIRRYLRERAGGNRVRDLNEILAEKSHQAAAGERKYFLQNLLWHLHNAGRRDRIDTQSGSLDAGPLAGPYTDLAAGCPERNALGQVDVNDGRVAYVVTDSCAEPGRRLVVRDTTSGAEVTSITLSEQQRELALRRVADAGVADRVDIVDGLEHAPDALRRLFTGENVGKQLVRIAEPAGR